MPEYSAKRGQKNYEINRARCHKAGKESVVLTLVEKVTDYYIVIKIPGKTSEAVLAALEVLRENTERIFFAHPYSSWERSQNERHNRIFRRYISKGVSIEKYTAE